MAYQKEFPFTIYRILNKHAAEFPDTQTHESYAILENSFNND